MNNIQTIIFDYDGTLHDSMVIYEPAFRKGYDLLVKAGVAEDRPYTAKEISSWLGYSAKEAWDLFLPGIPQEYKEKAGKLIGKEMEEAINGRKAKLYPGVEQVLKELKEQGYCLVLLSNCNQNYLDGHQKLFQLERYIDHFYCGEQFDFIPKGKILQQVMGDLPPNYLVVGDRKHDFEMANEHGIPAVACTYGYGNEGEYAMAQWRIRKISELPQLMKEISGSVGQ